MSAMHVQSDLLQWYKKMHKNPDLKEYKFFFGIVKKMRKCVKACNGLKIYLYLKNKQKDKCVSETGVKQQGSI